MKSQMNISKTHSNPKPRTSMSMTVSIARAISSLVVYLGMSILRGSDTNDAVGTHAINTTPTHTRIIAQSSH